MHTNATYMFRFFYYSLCGISGQLSGRFAIVRQTIPVLAEIKNSLPRKTVISFFDLNEGAVALAEDLLKKDRKRFILLSIRM